MSLSLIIPQVSSWGPLLNPVGDEGLNYLTRVDFFLSGIFFVSLSTITDVHINLSHVLPKKFIVVI